MGSEVVVEGTKHTDFKVASLWRYTGLALIRLVEGVDAYDKFWLDGFLSGTDGPVEGHIEATDASHFLGIVELDVRGHLYVAALVAKERVAG